MFTFHHSITIIFKADLFDEFDKYWRSIFGFKVSNYLLAYFLWNPLVVPIVFGDAVWTEASLKQSVQRSLNLLFQHTLFLVFPLFQKYINPQDRTNKLANRFVYHLCSSILASGIKPYFFKLLRVLSLSRMLVQFSLTCIFHHVWEKIFNLWCSH